MFSDMFDYTGMMERLGDREALRVVEDHNRIVRTQCEAQPVCPIHLHGHPARNDLYRKGHLTFACCARPGGLG